MKERPIPYSAPMVRARRAGLKTNTRRLISPQPEWRERGELAWCGIPIDAGWQWKELSGWPDAELPMALRKHCPYGQPGDRLWPREAWRTLAQFDSLPPRDVPQDAPIWYEADGPAPAEFGRYRHARFMPRWVSRGLDEVVEVRTERLQDISEEDAKREGVNKYDDGPIGGMYVDYEARQPVPADGPIHSFKTLWQSINGPGSWDANPWVWVVEFKVLG